MAAATEEYDVFSIDIDGDIFHDQRRQHQGYLSPGMSTTILEISRPDIEDPLSVFVAFFVHSSEALQSTVGCGGFSFL